jgi:hypothetical protein
VFGDRAAGQGAGCSIGDRKENCVLDLLLFLVKLPFILIRIVASLLLSLTSLWLGLVGGVLSGLWTLFVAILVVLLVVWLVVVLPGRRRVRMV